MAKETIDKILSELEKVKLIVQQISATGKFPDIEKDIVLSKLRNIYEFINFIQPVHPIATVTEESVTSVMPTGETTKKIEIVEKPALEADIFEIKIESTTKIKESNPSVKEEIIAEKLKETGEFMNDAFAHYAQAFDLTKKMQTQPIADISAAIGLNDKFLFTKELFHNDSDLYKHTIDTLNKASNFDNAIQYIDSNFKWDFENPSVHKLLELIRRRFPSS